MLAGLPPTAADLPALRHTAMAIKEAMRLYPPAFALGRRSESQTEIGGYVIPAGSDVLVGQYATLRKRCDLAGLRRVPELPRFVWHVTNFRCVTEALAPWA